MSYDYKDQKKELFTESGMETYIAVRDHTLAILGVSGAIDISHAIQKATGDTWTMLAAIDYMVEKGLIVEIPRLNCATQNRVFVKA